jgi:hypothetical protein
VLVGTLASVLGEEVIDDDIRDHRQRRHGNRSAAATP